MTSISSLNNLSNKEIFQTKPVMETRFSKLIKNISTLAIPIIGMVLLNSLPMANANKFTDCIENCDKFDGGATKLLCYALCAALDIFA